MDQRKSRQLRSTGLQTFLESEPQCRIRLTQTASHKQPHTRQDQPSWKFCLPVSASASANPSITRQAHNHIVMQQESLPFTIPALV